MELISILVSLSQRTVTPPAHVERSGACQPQWRATFGSALGTSQRVASLAVLDDGSGPALFVGGEFERAGSVVGNGIAKWDGARWSALGDGFETDDVADPASVSALATFDDGAGPRLYAGGYLKGPGFTPSYVARWDGTSWQDLGLSDSVSALAVFDDGSGPALYAGGRFQGPGTGNFISRWDGSTWSPVGGGVDATVSALTVFDDGSGPALYVGGRFRAAGAAPANRIAKWNGTSWSALDGGVDGSVSALTVFDDGAGPALYAGGTFRNADGLPARFVAKWDGSSWSALGAGMDNGVDALAAFDDGGGPQLVAAGSFTSAGGLPASHVARWDGSAWTALGSGTSGAASALAVFDDGGGAELYVGGDFATAGGEDVAHLARWDGSDWSPVGGSTLGTLHSTRVSAVEVFDDGAHGAQLYVAGTFEGVGRATDVARWDGGAWARVGNGTGSGAHDAMEALAVFDDGSGPALHLGGAFTAIGGVAASHVARWDGSSWSPLGSGVGGGNVQALTVFDDGGGDALYAGGTFTSAGGAPAGSVARWDGASWSPLAGGTGFHVYAFAVHDSGGGAALYAGGASVARWDGSAWSPVGGAFAGGAGPVVYALEVFDDGSGPALYAGGGFASAGGAPASNVARWNGSAWSGVGGGVSGTLTIPWLPWVIEPTVHALRVFDDGSGPALYAGGSFTSAGGAPAAHVARWDGASWSPLGAGLSGQSAPSVQALAVHTAANGDLALYAAGRFFGALDSGDGYVARWQGCLDVTAPTILDADDVLVREVPGSPPGEVVTFSVTAEDNGDAFPPVRCTPPSGSVFPPGVTLVSCESTDAAGNVATATFRVTVHGGPARRKP